MVSRNKRTIVVRRRGTRGFSILTPIFSAISRSARRPLGIMFLVLAIALTINYNSDPDHKLNWITTLVTKLQTKTAWKWLGDYLSTRVKQLVHSSWLVATSFLATRPDIATILALVLTAITLSLSPTTDWDITLQCLVIYLFFGVRNYIIRILTVVLFFALLLWGKAFIEYS